MTFAVAKTGGRGKINFAGTKLPLAFRSCKFAAGFAAAQATSGVQSLESVLLQLQIFVTAKKGDSFVVAKLFWQVIFTEKIG